MEKTCPSRGWLLNGVMYCTWLRMLLGDKKGQASSSQQSAWVSSVNKASPTRLHVLCGPFVPHSWNERIGNERQSAFHGLGVVHGLHTGREWYSHRRAAHESLTVMATLRLVSVTSFSWLWRGLICHWGGRGKGCAGPLYYFPHARLQWMQNEKFKNLSPFLSVGYKLGLVRKTVRDLQFKVQVEPQKFSWLALSNSV